MRRLRPVGLLEHLAQSSYSALFLLWIFMNLLCTAVYFAMTEWLPAHGPTINPALPPLERLWESGYFSLVTATTVGYGDILPQGLSKGMAGLQAAVGVLIFGILIAKLVARRNDEVMTDVHRLTSESIFYHIRQGLFIVRKDFDTLIRDVEHHGHLPDHEWDNLNASCLQAQSLIEEIPNFYANSNGYVIDRKRETLLIDSIERTLTRLLHLLAALDHRQIKWKEHDTSAEQLESLAAMIDTLILVWEKHSPNHAIEHNHTLKNLQQLLRQEVVGSA